MRRSTPPEPEFEYDGPSKGQRKREAHAAQELGEQLIGLPDAELTALQLPETLHDAIVEARGINSRGGGLRQRQYIGKLMRGVDLDPIREALAARAAHASHDVQRFHRVESWRSRLLREGPEALAELQRTVPGLDAADLRRKLAAAQAEHARTLAHSGAEAKAAGTASRELFRALRDILG